MSANWDSGYESAFRVAGIEKRSSAFDLVAFNAENGVHCSGKCSGSIGISSVFQGCDAKNTSNLANYATWLRSARLSYMSSGPRLASQDLSRTPHRPNKTNPARRWRTGSDIPLKDAYSYLSYVSIARAFFQPSWLAIVQPKVPLAQRSPIASWAGESSYCSMPLLARVLFRKSGFHFCGTCSRDDVLLFHR
jgi:hypothetical protein